MAISNTCGSLFFNTLLDGLMIVLEQILNWFVSIGARPLDALFIAILFLVRLNDLREIKALRAKVELLNTGHAVHAWIIHLKLNVKTIKRHRSGDYELVSPIDEIEGE